MLKKGRSVKIFSYRGSCFEILSCLIKNCYHHKNKQQREHMPANGGEDVGKEQSLYTAGGNISCCSHCGNLYRASLKKKKLLYFPAMLLLGINLRSLSQWHIKETLAHLCLFLYYSQQLESGFAIVAQKQKKLIKKMRYTYTLEFYAATKSKTVIFARKWLYMCQSNLENRQLKTHVHLLSLCLSCF